MSAPGKITTTTGHELLIRPPRNEDLDQLLAYINDLIKEDTYIVMCGKPVSRKEESEWLTSTLKKINRKEQVALLVFDGKKLVANSAIEKKIRRLSHIGDFGISVAASYRNQGIGKELMRRVLEQGKKTLGITMAVLEVFGNNPRAQHVYEKLGFIEYGRLPKAILYRGEYVDLVQMYKLL